jgi:peptidoglycan-associated lipoprotein
MPDDHVQTTTSQDPPKSTPLPAGLDSTGSGVPLPSDKQSWVPAADQPFKGETVYFDYDKSTIKAGEVAKAERVASGIKALAGKALRIEGHCDERGTEEYNRSLGERRALAVRETLMRSGVDANLIDTISLGEDRPAEPGHNEAAWSKNRRGEFIVIEPPSAAATSNGK